jgi:hypothetical protein
MKKVFDRAALAACIAITALSMAVSAEGRDLDRSSRSYSDATRSLSAPIRGDRGAGLPSLRGSYGARLTPAAPRRKRGPRRFDTRVAPRPDSEMGQHGCVVRNRDRRGAV